MQHVSGLFGVGHLPAHLLDDVGRFGHQLCIALGQHAFSR